MGEGNMAKSIVVKEPNPLCPLISKPCIEDECAAFQRERRMTVEERRRYAAADNPLACSGVLMNIRWCAQFNRDIPQNWSIKEKHDGRR